MDTIRNSYGMKSDAVSGTQSLDKLVHFDSQPSKFIHNPQQKNSFISLQRHTVGAERALSQSSNLWSSTDKSNPVTTRLLWDNHFENKLFSSSLSELLSHNLELSSKNDTITSHNEEDEPFESLEEIEAQTIGNLLPDDDDLLSGVVDGIDSFAPRSGENELDDLDLFSSVGGMELRDDSTSFTGQRNSEFFGNSNRELIGINSSFSGEGSYSEYPSRTLFVRNVNSNVEDSELRALFEKYGDLRTLYTACKNRGFVMISYFDIRAAQMAMKALQNKPLRLRRLDIHYSIPKDNPSEKDMNQGTLVVTNLDSSVSNRDLEKIFGAFGEIKEINETLCTSNQKLIEFYDTRAANEALHALNQSDISGKKIKVEWSRPKGARQSSTQPMALQGLKQEEPLQESSAGFLGGSIISTNMENDTCSGSSVKPCMEGPTCHGISFSVPNGLPSLLRPESTSSQPRPFESRNCISRANNGFQGLSTFYPRSLPEYRDGLASNMPTNVISVPRERAESTHLGRTQSMVNLCDGITTSGNSNGLLHGHHYMWSNSNHQPPPSFKWSNPPLSNGFSTCQSQLHFHGPPRSLSHLSKSILPMNSHHVGSAPAVIPSFWDSGNSYLGRSPDPSCFYPGPLYNMDFVSHIPHGGGNIIDIPISSRNVGLHGQSQRGIMYRSRSQMNMVGSFEHPGERFRSHRSEKNPLQGDNRKQYELDIGRIRRGEDNRTTLMIKNIPNKYTSKMLMATIDERQRGTYDFIYLPIDFKNKCNVGYAFINMVDPSHIIPLYEMLNGKKWEKFNSEKIASLAYARIQGKAALIAHFQNSSLLNEDKRCRPILFHSDGSNVGDQVPFPMSANIRSKPGKSHNEDDENESPPNLRKKDQVSCRDSF